MLQRITIGSFDGLNTCAWKSFLGGSVSLPPGFSEPPSILVLCEISALFLTTNFWPVSTGLFLPPLTSVYFGKRMTQCGTNAQNGWSIVTSFGTPLSCSGVTFKYSLRLAGSSQT